MVARSFDDYWEIKTLFAQIEALIDRWGRSIVGKLENGGQAAAEHAGKIFEVR